ncbi:hypothetical protein SAMN05518672_1012 [Chitinophaga sp. CF118]|nr:hypothetical protein SAMN05518672_1012 [Chitinophaga sp. CF118]
MLILIGSWHVDSVRYIVSTSKDKNFLGTSDNAVRVQIYDSPSCIKEV